MLDSETEQANRHSQAPAGLRIAVYHNLHSGGARRVVAEQVKYLRKRHVVKTFSLSGADHEFGEEGERATLDLQLFDFNPLPFAPSPYGRLNPLIGLVNFARMNATAKHVARTIDAGHFDVVLVHPCQLTQSPLLLRWLRTPTVYYCHELPRRLYEPRVARPYDARSLPKRVLDTCDPLPYVGARTHRWLDRRAARRASIVVANSQFTAENVRNAYTRSAIVCAPGVDSNAFTPSAPERRGFVLSVGAMTPLKGFDFIIRAIGTIPKAERPRFVIVSNYQEGAEHGFLQALAREHDVVLECRTAVPESDLRALYAQAACVAYAPINEPLGLVALEAMAAGTPVVAVAEGGPCETVIDQHTGYLTPRDEHCFGQALQRLLQDSDAADSLGSNGRCHVQAQWSWERHLQKLENTLSVAAGRVAVAEMQARPVPG